MVCLQQERPIGLFQTEKGFFSRLHHKEINFSVNPLTLRAAKRGLTNLEIFYLQKYFLENNQRRIVDQKVNNNSPSNILWNFASFTSYFRKYESSRRYLLGKF